MLLIQSALTRGRRRGVVEYCEAARELRERAPNCRCLLAGSLGEGSLSIQPGEIAAYAPAVEYLGPAPDIRALLAEIRGSSGPDAVHQAYGLAANEMTRQASMLAFMDCFRLLGVIVLIGLPLAFLIRHFTIGKAGGAGH